MSNDLRILGDAISQRRPAVLRINRREGCESFDICLLADARPEGDDGIWTQLVCGEPARLDRIQALQAPLEAVFQNGSTQISFETAIIRRQKLFLRGSRLLIGWPTHLRVIERRKSVRERVPDHRPITASLQLPGRLLGPPQVSCRVYDLSASGAAFLCPPGSRIPALQPGQTLQVCVTLAGVEHHLEVQHRNTRILPDGAVRLGVEFAPDTAGDSLASAELQKLLDELRDQRMRQSIGVAFGRGAA